MEKLNIAEILKDCPKGMELDCTICDNVYLDEVTPHMIKCFSKDNVYNTIYFHHDGTYLTNQNAKCVIFPKGKTTWEGFQRPFKDGDVLVGLKGSIFIFKELIVNNVCDAYSSICTSYCGLDSGNRFKLSSDNWAYAHTAKFATEEEKEILFKAIKDNGYSWNAETKTLEKLIKPKFKVGDRIKHRLTGDVYKVLFISSNGCGGGVYDVAVTNEIGKSINIKEQDSYDLVPNKFDITTLKPFDKVLVRDNDKMYWSADIYSHHLGKDKICQFKCIGMIAEQCIPYESNEHLLGTANDCDDYYKTWE